MTGVMLMEVIAFVVVVVVIYGSADGVSGVHISLYWIILNDMGLN